MNVLAVVAHPDDEVIGCGGALAKFARQGHRCRVLLAVRREDPRGRERWADLLVQFRRSVEILGGEPLVAEPLIGETQADPMPNLVHDAIVAAVDEADLILTHWMHDVNQVHRGVAKSVEIATRPFRRRRDVWLFETATSTEQGFGMLSPAFAPTLHVTLGADDVRRKLEAFAGYGTEFAPGRTVEDLERQLRRRGAECGVEFAEAFVAVRQYR